MTRERCVLQHVCMCLDATAMGMQRLTFSPCIPWGHLADFLAQMPATCFMFLGHSLVQRLTFSPCTPGAAWLTFSHRRPYSVCVCCVFRKTSQSAGLTFSPKHQTPDRLALPGAHTCVCLFLRNNAWLAVRCQRPKDRRCGGGWSVTPGSPQQNEYQRFHRRNFTSNKVLETWGAQPGKHGSAY